MEDQSEPTPSNASIGCFVHRMGCVFSSNVWFYINQHCITINPFFFGYWCFLYFISFFNLNLHNTLPPSYPIDLTTMLTYIWPYQLTTNPYLFILYLFLAQLLPLNITFISSSLNIYLLTTFFLLYLYFLAKNLIFLVKLLYFLAKSLAFSRTFFSSWLNCFLSTKLLCLNQKNNFFGQTSNSWQNFYHFFTKLVSLSKTYLCLGALNHYFLAKPFYLFIFTSWLNL